MPTILEEFEPMFKEYNYIVDIFGGRGGARSHHLTLHAWYQLLYNKYFRGFFIREVHSTIYSSVWQDFKDRREEMQEEGIGLTHIIISDNKNGENYARNNTTGATIVTKGFKAGSGTQTANLKSLAGATHIYIEEAEEVDKSKYDKLILSLRKKGVEIQIIRAFNPPPKEHWIWNDYDLYPVTNEDLKQIIYKVSNDDRDKIDTLVNANTIQFMTAKSKDNRLVINTNYFNNYEHINEQTINKIEAEKYIDFFNYCTAILGLIASGNERSVYSGWEKITEAEHDKKEGNILYVLDFGDVVPNALVEIKFNGEWRHYKQLLYTPDRELPIVEALDRLQIPKDKLIIADSASPNQIKKIREAGYLIRAVSKGHDANISAIQSIRTCKVTVCGDDMWNEYVNYKYEENKTGELIKDQVPQKGNDHCMDGIKYGEIGKKYVNH